MPSIGAKNNSKRNSHQSINVLSNLDSKYYWNSKKLRGKTKSQINFGQLEKDFQQRKQYLRNLSKKSEPDKCNFDSKFIDFGVRRGSNLMVNEHIRWPNFLPNNIIKPIRSLKGSTSGNVSMLLLEQEFSEPIVASKRVENKLPMFLKAFVDSCSNSQSNKTRVATTNSSSKLQTSRGLINNR